MPNWSDDAGNCHFDVDGVPCHESGTGCPMHRAKPTPKSKRRTEIADLRATVEGLTFQRDLARLNRDLEAKAFREERTAHGATRFRVQEATSVLWRRGRIDVRLDDATTTPALADALTGLFDEIDRLRAEVRKQVFGSGVVFDREVVERAEAAGPDADKAKT